MCTKLSVITHNFDFHSLLVTIPQIHTSNMVFTAPQQTLFFENAAQMGLINRTRVNLQTEGITDVSDLADWEDDDWDNWSSNSRSPPRIPDLTNAGQQIYHWTKIATKFLSQFCEIHTSYLDLATSLFISHQSNFCRGS